MFALVGGLASLMMFLPEQSSGSVTQNEPATNYETMDESAEQITQQEEIDNQSIASSGMFPRRVTLTENLIDNDILGILKEEFERDEEFYASGQQPTSSTDGTNERTPVVKNYYGVRKALRTRMAMILLITFGLSTNSSYFIIAMGKPFGQTVINDDHFLATIISFASIANCVGSFLCGKILDKIKFKV